MFLKINVEKCVCTSTLISIICSSGEVKMWEAEKWEEMRVIRCLEKKKWPFHEDLRRKMWNSEGGMWERVKDSWIRIIDGWCEESLERRDWNL